MGALVALLSMLLASSRAAHAQPCGLRSPECDEDNPECYVCEDPAVEWGPPDARDSGDSDSLRPLIGRSTGAELGATVFNTWKVRNPNTSPAPVPPGPSAASNHNADGEDVVERYWRAVALEDIARRGVVNPFEVVEAYQAQPGSGVPVPRDQGPPRDVGADGRPRIAEGAADHTDPVDPITGELVIEHVDLAFPSFGVPFAHQRTYRSRVDYRGPLGPGWDHAYNQRLVEAPPPPRPDGEPVVSRTGLPLGDFGNTGVLSPDPSAPTATCGPVLVLTTGVGTSLRFREIARQGDTISYESAPELTLIGAVHDDETTWELRGRGGDVRRFDSRGLLVAWTDANGVGLALRWEAGGVRDWRLDAVVDSVGRRIEYDYDGLDRLVRVAEAKSGLFASYAYDDHGGLSNAMRGDGRSERYEYDVAAGRSRGDWIPEGALQEVCEQACAVSGSSCDAGGACDDAVSDALATCMRSCPECAAKCNEECGEACGDDCSNQCGSQCRAYCAEPSQVARMQAGCEQLYTNTGARDACEGCEQVCEESANESCSSIVTCLLLEFDSEAGGGAGGACVNWVSWGAIGYDLLFFVETMLATWVENVVCVLSIGLYCPHWSEVVIDQLCDHNIERCCSDGDFCAPGSCNEGTSCETACRNTFMGDGYVNECAPPELGDCLDRYNGRFPAPGTDEYRDLLLCAGGTATDWAAVNGCMPVAELYCYGDCSSSCKAPCNTDCRNGCAATCARECHQNDCGSFCLAQDFAGQCRDSCAATCVNDIRALGSFVGPKYGYEADLDFNIVRVYDGNGALYLENTYEADIASPDFDTVTFQRYGDHIAALSHVDLSSGSAPALWAAGMVESLADYDAPDICPYMCEAAPPDPRATAVPFDDLVLVFDPDAGGESPAGGWTVTASSISSKTKLAPTFIAIDGHASGYVARRASGLGALDDKTSTLELALTGG
ncbi:MAG TPA: DUF6531 domain-containing protein, partial [Kofleriaceae bacterium]|nr:DUF6531 domain-containing protein [Kofleriaceae bacterium]